MSAQEVHAAVLAAVENAERIEAAGTEKPWEWDHHYDSTARAEVDGPLRREGGSTSRVIAAHTYGMDNQNAALIVASRNAWPASLALVRLVVERHAPGQSPDPHHEPNPDDPYCHGSDMHYWPCYLYRAAAAVVGIEVAS